MSTAGHLLERLTDAGINISGELPMDELDTSPGWFALNTQLANSARQPGIRLIRRSLHQPTDEQLRQILRSYSFTGNQRMLVFQNILDHDEMEIS
jgi:hypothetical protein